MRHMAAVWQQVQDRQVVVHPDSDKWPTSMAALLAVQDRLVRSGAWTTGPSSLIDVLGLSRAEVHNCRVLRWLLDPLARHGLGAVLTATLSEHLGSPLASPHTAQIHTEVARKNSRADVVIEDLESGTTIVIEAKIDAPEGLEQGRRLEVDWPEADPLVFLTVAGIQPPRTCADPDRWTPLSWAWIAEQADATLSAATEATNPRMTEARQAVAAWVAATRRKLS